MDKRGRIEVDDQFRTNVKSILAIGDVIPGPMLAHKVCSESSWVWAPPAASAAPGVHPRQRVCWVSFRVWGQLFCSKSSSHHCGCWPMLAPQGVLVMPWVEH